MARQRISEIRLIEELERSRDALADPDSGSPLALWLRSRYPGKCKPAFILQWIPEQGEDIYEVLLADETVVTVEILRRAGTAMEIKLDEVTRDLYHVRRRKPGRSWRRKYEAALKLLREAKGTPGG